MDDGRSFVTVEGSAINILPGTYDFRTPPSSSNASTIDPQSSRSSTSTMSNQHKRSSTTSSIGSSSQKKARTDDAFSMESILNEALKISDEDAEGYSSQELFTPEYTLERKKKRQVAIARKSLNPDTERAKR
jgi:hypothetical protein